MPETPTTERQPLRFTRITRGAWLLATPLPERLWTQLPAKLRREHEQLAARVEQSGQEIAKLKRAVDEAPARDREATTEAALEGHELPVPTEPKLRAELDEALRIREALEAALRQSADRLLAGAEPSAEKLAGELEQELDALADEVRSRLAGATEAVRDLAELTGQAGWTRGLTRASGQSVSPFQSGRSSSFTATLGEISTAGQAFEHELGQLAERRREAEAFVEEQARFNADEQRRRTTKEGD